MRLPRIPRMGLIGLMTVGWVYMAIYMVVLTVYVAVLFCKMTVLFCKAIAMVFLALMKEIDRYNRRRAVRKAYERDRARRDVYYRPRPSVPVQEAPYDPWTTSYTPAWQQPEPRDNPYWTPRA
jgi:hypothetical protein